MIVYAPRSRSRSGSECKRVLGRQVAQAHVEQEQACHPGCGCSQEAQSISVRNVCNHVQMKKLGSGQLPARCQTSEYLARPLLSRLQHKGRSQGRCLIPKHLQSGPTYRCSHAPPAYDVGHASSTCTWKVERLQMLRKGSCINEHGVSTRRTYNRNTYMYRANFCELFSCFVR